MSVNKHLPHVLVLPEDDANRQIANGFLLDHSVRSRMIQILPVARGWPAVRDSFQHMYNQYMQQYQVCLMVLLIDFDGRGAERLDNVLSSVEDSIRDRVFVLGTSLEPEKLKASLGSYERIGKALARECADGKETTWSHPLLKHNDDERTRMMPRIKPILFG